MKPSCDMAAFSNLPSLTKLALCVSLEEPPGTLPRLVDALSSWTGLAELDVAASCQSAVVPAALGQLKALRSLQLTGLRSCVLEAGCLEVPNLLSLGFHLCSFTDTEALPGVTALQSLTRIEFATCRGPRWFDRQLVQLPRLAQLLYTTGGPPRGGASPWLSRLPAVDMGLLTLTLSHITCRGLGLTQFPLALTQLAALEHLDASRNDFAEVPAAITALSRLTALELGRTVPDDLEDWDDPPYLYMDTLDARAVDDLSAFPALRWLQLPIARWSYASRCRTPHGTPTSWTSASGWRTRRPSARRRCFSCARRSCGRGVALCCH